MKKNSDRTLTAVVVAVVLLALIGFGIAVQNVDQIFPEIASATPKPQPISKTVALPSFLDGCLRHEENTLTITEMDGMVSLLQKYRCEVNELTEADKQLLAQGIPSINTQEVHFSMEIQIIPEASQLQHQLLQEMIEWQKLVEYVGCFYHCVRLSTTEINEANIMNYAEVLDEQAWQVDQIYRIDYEVFGTVGDRLFMFNIAEVLKPSQSTEEINVLDVTDPQVIAKIRPLVYLEVPQ